MSRPLRPDQPIKKRHADAVLRLNRRRCSPPTPEDYRIIDMNQNPEPAPVTASRRTSTATSTEYMSMPRVVPEREVLPLRPEIQEEVTPEDLKKLRKEIGELVVELKKPKSVPQSDDYQELFLRRLYANGTIKYYTGIEHGFKVLEDSPGDPAAIRSSKLNILDFLYRQSIDVASFTPLVTDVLDKVDGFMASHGTEELRSGAFSVAIDFCSFPPNLIGRPKFENGTSYMFRPVVVDGVAVQYAASNSSYRPFSQPNGNNPKSTPWCHFLNLSVKPLFHIIVMFLIRGHKTKVYLPEYYQQYVTKGRVSKVDDIFAFRRLIELGFIVFKEIKKSDATWFNAMARVADSSEAVFVSSQDFRRLPAVPKFDKPSERILTPCFLNDQDRLMLLEPNIRYKDQNGRFAEIPAEKILYFEMANADRNAARRLQSQLYLQEQIHLICELCQIYPMKLIQKVSIQQLFVLMIRADAGIAMPGMEEQDFHELMASN